MQSFDVLSHKTDIRRSLLLEASAGTGKTFFKAKDLTL